MNCVEKRISQNGSTLTEPTEDKSARGKATLNLSAPAKEILDQIREKTGVPKETALTRILEWFAELDPRLRLAVIVNDETTRDELLRTALANMLDETKELSYTDALGQMQTFINTMAARAKQSKAKTRGK